MREGNLRIAAVVVDLFAGVSAIGGAIGLLVGFINSPISVLNRTPFVDFTVPALLLGIVVGGSALAAAVLAISEWRRLTPLGPWRVDALATSVAGCIMLGWIAIEVALLGLSSWMQPFYFVVGLLMIGLAALLQRSETSQTLVGVRRRAAV